VTKTELIDCLTDRFRPLPAEEIDRVVRERLEIISTSLSTGEPIKIRGFGSFTLHRRPPRIEHIPKKGAAVGIPAVRVPHSKSGKDLQERVNQPTWQAPILGFSAKYQVG
jgi:integration host factor subunit beta